MAIFKGGGVILLLFAVTVGGLKIPKHHDLEHALKQGNENGHETSLEWHDQDYFDWGSSDWSYEYSDEEDTVNKGDHQPHHHNHSKTHAPITIGIEKNESSTTKMPEKVEVITSTVKTPPVVSPVVASSSSAPSPDVKKNEKDDMDWADYSGEDDDEEEVIDLLLPRDNDTDAEKYFDPVRYQDKLNLHMIEDILNQEWTVSYDNTNLPCILLKGDIRMVVPMTPNWFNLDYVELIVPPTAKASGTCNSPNNDFQEIILQWNATIPGSQKVYLNSIYFGFNTNWTSEFSDKNISEGKYALTMVTASYYNGEINVNDPKADQGIASYSVSDIKEFETPLNQSMSCYKKKSILLNHMQLTFENIHLEAFRPNTETLTPGEFSQSVLCDMDEEYVFDALMTFIIWFWIGALFVVIIIFSVLLAMGYRRKKIVGGAGFGYKILEA